MSPELLFFILFGCGIIWANVFRLRADILQKFIVNIGAPVFLFIKVFQQPLDRLLYVPFIATLILGFFCVGGIAYFLAGNLPSKSKVMFVLNSAYMNTVLFGLPAIHLLLGDATSAVVGTMIQVLLFNSTAVVLLNVAGSGKKRQAVLKAIMTPLFLLPLLGFFFNCLHADFLCEPVNFLMQGFQFVPKIGIFYFGTQILFSEFKKFRPTPFVMKAVALKLWIHPLMAFVLGKFVFDLSSYWLQSILFLSMGPTAMIIFFMAQKYQAEAQNTKQVVLITSVAAVLMITLLRLFE